MLLKYTLWVLFSVVCWKVVQSKFSCIILGLLTAKFLFCLYHDILNKYPDSSSRLKWGWIFLGLLQLFPILKIISMLTLRHPKTIIQKNHGL